MEYISKPVNWFLRELPIFRCISQLLPVHIQHYDNSEHFNPLSVFDIFNRAYSNCCSILNDNNIEVDFYEKYDTFMGYSYDPNINFSRKTIEKDKWITITIYILLNYESQSNKNPNIHHFLDFIKTEGIQDHFPFDTYLSKAMEFPEFYDNPKSCNFDDEFLLPADYAYSDEEFFAISNRLATFTIENIIDVYNVDESVKSLIFKAEHTWKVVLHDKHYCIHDMYPINSFFIDYLWSKVGVSTLYSKEELANLQFGIISKAHYPFDIFLFNTDLLAQIQHKYDNGAQDSAREMWKRLYNKIKPYELQVECDFETADLYFQPAESELVDRILTCISRDNTLTELEQKLFEAVRSMKTICDKYHRIVEPFEMFEAESTTNKSCSLTRKQVMYLIHKSGLYNGNGTTNQWGAVLNMLTGYSQHTIRQDILKYSKPDDMTEDEMKHVDDEYKRLIESMKK